MSTASPFSTSVPDRPSRAVASVIIPAHNEEAVISRTLAPLAGAAEEGRLEVIVVCNACEDRTAERASAFAGVEVLETSLASKPNALDLGDQYASTWPRLYLDADIVAEEESLLATAQALSTPEVHAARPPARYDTARASPVVRAYYRARSRIPSMRTAMWGAGIYGLSIDGHARLHRALDLKGDDLWVDRLFAPREKVIAGELPVTVSVPRTLGALLAVTRRNVDGAREPGPSGKPERSARSTLRELRRTVDSPRSAVDAGVYAAIAVAARLGVRRAGSTGWERDDTSRA